MSSGKIVTLRYGKSGLTIRVPEHAAILRSDADIPTVDDAAAAVRAAIDAPIGSPPLSQLLTVRRPRTVAITISDITRPVPNRDVLPVLVERLNAAGVRDEDVTIVVGTGMHRPSTDAEKDLLIGPDLLARVAVVDHRSAEPETLVRVSADPPVSINRAFHDADFRIVTGLIEPHFMAGYSGGRKGICPALVDLETVQRFHGYELMGHPKCATGVLDGNPCHEESLRIARLVGCDFVVNVGIDSARQLAAVWAGDMEAAHLGGVEHVAEWTTARFAQPFDLVVTCGGGFPLDLTFYQTSKGMVDALAACHDDSVILVASHCGEGAGSPEFAAIMERWHDDWRGFLNHIAASDETVKDQWALQMQARVLERLGVENLRLVCDGLDAGALSRLAVTSIAACRRCAAEPAKAQWAFQLQARVLDGLGVENLRLVCDGLDAGALSRLAVTPIAGTGSAAQRLQAAIDVFVADRPDARIAVVPDGPYVQLASGAS